MSDHDTNEIHIRYDVGHFIGIEPKKEPCACHAPKIDHERIAQKARLAELREQIAQLDAASAEREQREAARIERERIEADRAELARVQAELDRAFSVKMAERDYARGLADSERHAREKADADESRAEIRIAIASLGRRDSRTPEDIARERADRDQKRWRR